MIRLALPGSFLAPLFLITGFASAQSVSIVSGNGQLVCPVCPAIVTQQFAPLVVQVNDANGQPVAAGTTVTWAAAPTTGTAPQTAQTATDDHGQASFNFVPVFPNNGSTFTQTPVKATALNASANFIETTIVPSQQTPGVAPVQITLQSPGQALTGSAGQTSSTPIKVQVTGLLGGIANVAVQLVSGPSPAPTVACAAAAGQQPGTVLTDATGLATCNPVFGGVIGSGSYYVAVGGTYVTFTPAALTVTAGPPAVVKIVSGNNQSANPGAAAPLSLVAQVTDLGGNPSAGAAVTWNVTQGSATLSNTTTTSNSIGQVSTRVTAGSGGGQILIQVSVPNTTATATFTLNVKSVITDFEKLSGDNQAAQQGKAFAEPLVVQVNNQGQPVEGVAVTFVVTSGSAALSALTAATDAQGQAQVSVTAGQTLGPVVITASIGGSTLAALTFNLNVANGPVFSSAGVTNTAGFQPGFISPCGLATIFGSGFATGLQGFVSTVIAPQFQVAGVTVQFGNAGAPILSVVNQNGQESVTVQVPCEVVPADNVPLTVSIAGGGSTTVNVPVLSISPGLFQTTMSDGKMRAVLVRPDGSYVSLENPARRGEIIRMYATGLGQTTPPLVTGQTVPLVEDASGNLVPQDLPVNAQVVIGVNNAGVRVVSAKYAYGMAGVYEVQFEIPPDTAPGNDAPFAIAVYQGTNLLFGNPSAIPIQ